MKDRVSLHPNRYKLTPVNGQADTYDLSRADEPLEAGTPITKATMFDDEIANIMGLTPENGTPNEGFKKIDNRVDRLDLFKIGDIRTTVKDDLGDDYLLCNGATIDRNDYPELCEYTALPFPRYYTAYKMETDDEGGSYVLEYCSTKDGAVYVDGKWVFAGSKSGYYGTITVAENLNGPWAYKLLGYNVNINDICYGGKGVWAIGTSEWNEEPACVKIATDPLGSWTTKSISDISYGSVGKFATNGDGVFCAVANRGYSGANQHRIVYSLDNGSTWTSKQPVTSGATINWNDIAYGNGLWVMIGSKTEYISGKNYSAPVMAYATAPNGTWTMIALDDYTVNGGLGIMLERIAYSNNEWMMTGWYRVQRTVEGDSSNYYQYYFLTYTFDNNSVSSPTKYEQDLGIHYTNGSNEVTGFLSYHSLIFCNNKWMALGGTKIAETTDPAQGWTIENVTLNSGLMKYPAMTDGTRWMAALDYSGYVTSEYRYLPNISTNGAYTYIKAKESNDGYK